jgi:peptide/nickel transport system permease protein
VGSRGYVLKKVLQALLTLFFVLIFNFFLFRILPSDPVKFLTRGAGLEISPEEQQQLLEDFGLDKPVWPITLHPLSFTADNQFFDYLGDTARLQFGTSLTVQSGRSVLEIFFAFMWPTLLLVGVSTFFSVLLGVWMGIRAGWRRGGAFDRTSMGISLVLYSMPEFWLGMLFIILFSTTLGWFPNSGRTTLGADYTGFSAVIDVLNHLFLPALTLTLAYLGEYYLVMRSSLLDVLGEDYIQTARAKGVREKMVLNKHAVRNALLPTISLVALSFGFVLGGAITVEVVFSYKGLGGLTYEALQSQDFPLLQVVFLFASAAVIFMNLGADLIYGYFDPRVREA